MTFRVAPSAIRRTRSARGGFTLLEVLAAVAILSIWFIVIAGTSVQGLRAEGESRRRLEAGMIADRILADLEASTTDGSVPEPTQEVREEGNYLLTISVAPFLGSDPSGGAPVGNPPAPGTAAAALPLDQLLATEMAERSANLQRLDVQVTWTEGDVEKSVTRTSFAFDLVAARQAYDAAGIQSSAPATATPDATAPEGDAEP